MKRSRMPSPLKSRFKRVIPPSSKSVITFNTLNISFAWTGNASSELIPVDFLNSSFKAVTVSEYFIEIWVISSEISSPLLVSRMNISSCNSLRICPNSHLSFIAGTYSNFILFKN